MDRKMIKMTLFKYGKEANKRFSFENESSGYDSSNGSVDDGFYMDNKGSVADVLSGVIVDDCRSIDNITNEVSAGGSGSVADVLDRAIGENNGSISNITNEVSVNDSEPVADVTNGVAVDGDVIFDEAIEDVTESKNDTVTGYSDSEPKLHIEFKNGTDPTCRVEQKDVTVASSAITREGNDTIEQRSNICEEKKDVTNSSTVAVANFKQAHDVSESDGELVYTRRACLQRQVAFDLEQDNAIINENSDTDDNEKYAIKQTVVDKLGGQPSTTPNLCSEQSHRDQLPSMCDGVVTESNSSEYEVEKRKPKIVEINKGKTNLIRIETVEYRYKGKKFRQHYVKKLKGDEIDICGDIGLRPKDLLLSLNGKPLENTKQKKVLKEFKRIKPQRKDGTIQLILIFRRWEHEEGQSEFQVKYRLTLTLKPDDGPENPVEKTHHVKCKLERHRSFRATNDIQQIKRSIVPPGQIDDLKEMGEVRGRLRVVYGSPDEYITVGNDGNVLTEVPTDIEKSNLIFNNYEARDRAPETYPVVFLRRISYKTHGTKMYLTSNIKNKDYSLKFQPSSVTTAATLQNSGNVDESFLILREYGDEILLESLLFRGYYVSCKRDLTSSLCMVKKSESEIEHQKNVEWCLFEDFCVVDNEQLHSGREKSLVGMFFDAVFACVSCRSGREQPAAYRPWLQPVPGASNGQQYSQTDNT